MKINIALVAFSLATLSVYSQDVYRVEQFSGSDLNGTARFVGMGGAMGALGADLSTINTNPAGIGAYRRSDVSFTTSLSTQGSAETFHDISKSRLSFDQAGFVYSSRMRESKLQFVNFGFNYHKQKNFKNFIGLWGIPTTNGLSQSDQMAQLSILNGVSVGDLTIDKNKEKVSPLATLGALSKMVDYDPKTGKYSPTLTEFYNYRRVQWGGIHAYDFNLSTNWEDQIYAGVTFGIYDVNYRTALAYDEYQKQGGAMVHDYHFNQMETLDGSGFDVKLGFILRPIATSSFRIGFSVHTPIWYTLTSNSTVHLNSPYQSTVNGVKQNFTTASSKINVDYKIRTPWKFNLNVGTTVGRNVALGAEYEYADYTGTDISFPNYDSYDPWTGGYNSYSDAVLKNEINTTLKGVHSVKLGAEAKLTERIYGRVGYNYITQSFKDNAYLNLLVQNAQYHSPSYFYQSRTDYANLGDINRFTFGLGYRWKQFYIDAAFQYQTQKAEVYAFYVYDQNSINSQQNLLQGQNVNLNRSNFILTMGVKF